MVFSFLKTGRPDFGKRIEPSKAMFSRATLRLGRLFYFKRKEVNPNLLILGEGFAIRAEEKSPVLGDPGRAITRSLEKGDKKMAKKRVDIAKWLREGIKQTVLANQRSIYTSDDILSILRGAKNMGLSLDLVIKVFESDAGWLNRK